MSRGEFEVSQRPTPLKDGSCKRFAARRIVTKSFGQGRLIHFRSSTSPLRFCICRHINTHGIGSNLRQAQAVARHPRGATSVAAAHLPMVVHVVVDAHDVPPQSCVELHIQRLVAPRRITTSTTATATATARATKHARGAVRCGEVNCSSCTPGCPLQTSLSHDCRDLI